MFERFDERARQAIVEGRAAARELDHTFIAPEHLLLGLVRIEEVVAALGPPAGDTTGQVPSTPAAQRCLERAIDRSAKAIRPAHVLRELLEVDGVAAILDEPAADDNGPPVEVRLGDELIGDLGNPHTDVRLIGAILRQDGLAAGWLRVAGIDEAWVREFGGGA